MRASEPSPSTSCICTIATRAGEAKASRISDQCGVALAHAGRVDRGVDLGAHRRRAATSYQPRTVSLSCVPV